MGDLQGNLYCKWAADAQAPNPMTLLYTFPDKKGKIKVNHIPNQQKEADDLRQYIYIYSVCV